jgi:hypothetical protein
VWKHCCEVLQEVFVHKYSLVLAKNVFVRWGKGVCLWYWSKWLLASAGESRGIGCVHRTKGQTIVFVCVLGEVLGQGFEVI